MLHVSPGSQLLDHDRISRCLQAVQSSSPSYLLLASLDAARLWAEDAENFAAPHEAALAAWAALSRVPGVELLGRKDGPGPAAPAEAHDPWRLTVRVEGMTGTEVAAALEQEFGVVPELSTRRAVVLCYGPGSTMEDTNRLVHAFRMLTGRRRQLGAGRAAADRADLQAMSLGAAPVTVLSPRDAFYAESERVDWSGAEGRISAELLSPYPPGIPLVAPGERVTAQHLEVLRSVAGLGGRVAGASDPSLSTLLVLKSELD